MGIFDYVCYIDNLNCPLKKSLGQSFTYGEIYAINKDLTKKIGCDYSGYGYAELSREDNYKKIYDLGFVEYYGEIQNTDKNKCYCYFACPNCAKIILYECDSWEEFIK